MKDFRDRIMETTGAESIMRRSCIRNSENAEALKNFFERFNTPNKRRIKTVLEIGTFRGVSAAFISQFCDRVITIDIKDGWLESTSGLVREKLWSALGIRNIEFREIENNDQKADLVKGLNFDLAFIDGAHDIVGVKTDFRCVRKCGRVLFDDFDITNDVGRFVWQLQRFEVFGRFAYWSEK